MRITRRVAALAAGPALIGALAVAAAPAAAADPSTTCVGMITDRAVDTDLRVPANGTCVLQDVEVDGHVTVEAGASLVVTDGTFNDGVVVGVDAFFDATDTVISRNLVSNGAYGVYLDEVLLGGHYIGRTGDVDSSFLYSKDSKVAGRMEAMQGEVHLDGTIVGRFLNTEGTDYTDIVDSSIVRELTVSRSGAGTTICGSDVGGDTTLLYNAGAQVGAGSIGSGCTGTNYFAGDLVISGNSGDTDVSGNNVRGDLKGGDNAPEPTGADNRVGGEELDDFSELGPQSVPAEADPNSDSTQHRSPEQLRADREDRRDSAVELGADIEQSRTNADSDQDVRGQDEDADDAAGSDSADDEDGAGENDTHDDEDDADEDRD